MLHINKKKCIGCKLCMGICPKKFDFNRNKAMILTIESCKDEDLAMLNCPTGAIEDE